MELSGGGSPKKLSLVAPGISMDDFVMGSTKYQLARLSPVSWLLDRSHVLLWADRIYLPKYTPKTLSREPPGFKGKYEPYIFLLDELKKEGIVEYFDQSSLLRSELVRLVFQQVEEDEKRWGKETQVDPLTGKGDWANIDIGGISVCRGMLGSTYTTLAAARKLDAGILWDELGHEICQKRFGEMTTVRTRHPFERVFNIAVPRIQVLPDYAVCYPHINLGQSCNNCGREQHCRKEWKDQLEDRLAKLLEFRARDEMSLLRKVVMKSIKTADREGLAKDDDAIAAIRHEEAHCRRMVKGLFPKAERWLNIATNVSLAASLFGAGTGNALVGFGGLAGMTSSKIADGSLSWLRSKYQWVGFLDELEAGLARKSTS